MSSPRRSSRRRRAAAAAGEGVAGGLPHRLRRVHWVLLKDVGLLSDVLTVFLRAVFALQRRRARRQGIRRGQVGAVSFIQFFSSALQVTPHFHSLVPDGVFVPREGGMRFEPLPPPTRGEVEWLLKVVRHRVLRLLESRSRTSSSEVAPSPLALSPLVRREDVWRRYRGGVRRDSWLTGPYHGVRGGTCWPRGRAGNSARTARWDVCSSRKRHPPRYSLPARSRPAPVWESSSEFNKGHRASLQELARLA
ncbi:hypothetical protein F0U63_01910 [Cystobacter fuscus]|nr:hypothetical protein F0U63_01910 [Cystobacter fuscus]